MPRIQSYIPSGVYKKMEDIIDGLIQDGATRSEANISSLTVRLIEMGLMLYEVQNKKEDEAEADGNQNSGFDSEFFLRESLKGSYKLELYSQIFLQFMLNPEMAKHAGDYESLKKQIHKTAEDLINKI